MTSAPSSISSTSPISQPPPGRPNKRGITLLAIGDVHLGVRPGRVPQDLVDHSVDPRNLTPEAALGAAVDCAIASSVDAVLFAGDVVESTNARFEALRPLEQAVTRLADAGIPVLAVVGNHDVEALPRLAGTIDSLQLLGTGGRWESHRIENAAGDAVEIVGWSFPQRQVFSSPVMELLNNPLSPAGPSVARIGLLHGDLGASGGPYAPFSRAELDSAAFDAWLLGHIHNPSLASAPVASSAGNATGPVGYLGSLVGLDPSERGAHGPWMIEIDGPGRVAARQLPIAPLRWEQVDIELNETATTTITADDVGDLLTDAMEGAARSIQAEGSTPLALGLRVQLVGATRDYDAVAQRAKAGAWTGLRRSVGETLVFIDRVSERLDLLIDLEEVSLGDDPPALLAQKLLTLQRGGDGRRELLDRTRDVLRPIVEDPRWSAVGDLRDAQDPLTDDALASLIEQSSRAALHALFAQSQSQSQSNGARGSGS